MTVRIVFTIADPRLQNVSFAEAADILRGVVERIEEGEQFAALFDSKGNEVGTFRVSQ